MTSIPPKSATTRARRRQSIPLAHIAEPRETLGEQAYQRMRHALMQGSFMPGESIPVRMVSDHLGIGVTPVREALQRLAAEGVLEGTANRGVRTARLDRTELEALYETRLLIEAEAASLAARRINPTELREVQDTFRRVVQAADAGDAPACLAANMEFHFRIYSASRLPPLVRFIEQMWLRIGPLLMERAQSRVLTARSFFGASRAAHERLLKALQRHDAPAARECVKQLLYAGYDVSSRA